MTFLVVVADPVVLERPPIIGRFDLGAVVVDFVRPFGSGLLIVFFAPDWAANQPAKSGSPLSSYDVVDVGFDTAGVPQGSSSSSTACPAVPLSSAKPPQSLLKSSASSSNAAAGSGDVMVGMVVVLFAVCSCMPGFEANGTGGLAADAGGGTDDER